MKKSKLSTACKQASLLLALSGASAHTLADGNVYGRISLENSEQAVSGAAVRVVGQAQQSVTNADGSFSLKSLPAGEYELEVDYLGVEKQVYRFTVLDNQNQFLGLQLKLAQELEEVLIYGQAGTANKALNQQRNSDKILSVLSSDAIGQFPDANVGESLARLPGVSIERDQGEGRYVRVRGLGPELNSVTVNGSKLSSPSTDKRAVGLDVLPSDMVGSLEISKTQTPDQDADALGGSINIKSVSAFDRDGLYYSYGLESSFDEKRENASPKISASFSNVFSLFGGEENLGIAASLSYQNREFGSDNIEVDGDREGLAIEKVEHRFYDIERERIGGALNIDFKPNATNQYYLRSLYSEREDRESRNSVNFEFDEGLLLGGSGAASNVIDDNLDGNIERELKNRSEIQKVASFVIGGEHDLDVWNLQYSLGYSRGSEKKPEYIDGAVFANTVAFNNLSYSSNRVPFISGPAGIYDPANFELDKVEMASTSGIDTEQNARFDLEREFSLAGHPAVVKFGGKISQREKRSQEEVFEYSDFADNSFNPGPELDYEFGRFGPSIRPSDIRAVLAGADEVERNLEESNVNDFTINEDINAAYAMLTWDINDLRILTGVRYEDTKQTSNGLEYNDDTESVTPTSAENSYDHILPALHLRYQLSDANQMRFAWTQSVVRPSFEQLSPGTFIEVDDNDLEIKKGDPSLDPWFSNNIDLGFESYFGLASSFSAFVFYKDIEDYIAEIELESDNGAGETKTETFANGDAAELLGLELSYSQKFEQLPAPWNGLLIAANATFTDSEATYAGRKIDLPNQSDKVGNLSLGYQADKFSLRLSANYKSDYLDELGGDASEDAFVEEQTQIDFSAKFWLGENLELAIHGINITDQEFYVYTANASQNKQYESYGPTWTIGLKYSNF